MKIPLRSWSIGRRHVIQALMATFVSAGAAPDARGQQAISSMPVVRISRGSFASEKYEAIRLQLAAAQQSLIPAIRELTGCLHFFAAIDQESGSMVNVSVWQSLTDAQQMQTLGPMIALAAEFTRAGVRFERPIINYETLWMVS